MYDSYQSHEDDYCSYIKKNIQQKKVIYKIKNDIKLIYKMVNIN